MKKVIILSGVSGCGKSTIAHSFVPDDKYRDGAGKAIVSADHFFIRDGVYQFDPSKLSQAHATCFRKFLSYLQLDVSLVIVDNTNTTEAEISPYYLAAQAFEYQCEIMTVSTDDKDLFVRESNIKKCAERNSHGVPEGVIRAQAKRLYNRKLPHYWKHSVLEAKF
jgi:predicted ABC-type ATPase